MQQGERKSKGTGAVKRGQNKKQLSGKKGRNGWRGRELARDQGQVKYLKERQVGNDPGKEL